VDACAYLLIVNCEAHVPHAEAQLIKPTHRGIVRHREVFLYLSPGQMIPKFSWWIVRGYADIISVKAIGYLLLVLTIQDMVGLHQ